MKTYAYLILAAIVCSILIQPLTEIALVCKDRVQVGAAITNSVRAAKKECYSYYAMRDLNADADREKFVDTFAEIFAKSLDLRRLGEAGGNMVFESIDGRYNTFYVTCSFTPSRHGDRQRTNICVESTSEYQFKTKYLREAQNAIRASGNMYQLHHRRYYNMSMTN